MSDAVLPVTPREAILLAGVEWTLGFTDAVAAANTDARTIRDQLRETLDHYEKLLYPEATSSR